MFEEKRIIFLNQDPDFSTHTNPKDSKSDADRKKIDLGEKTESKEARAEGPEQEKSNALKESADKAMAVMNDLNDLRFLLPRLSDSKDQDWATKRFLKQIDDFFTGPEGQNKEGAIGTLERISQKAGSSEGLQEGDLERYTEEITALVETANEFLSSLEGRLSENFEKNYEDNKELLGLLKENNGVIVDKQTDSFTLDNTDEIYNLFVDGKPHQGKIEGIAKIVSITPDNFQPKITYILKDGSTHSWTRKHKEKTVDSTPKNEEFSSTSDLDQASATKGNASAEKIVNSENSPEVQKSVLDQLKEKYPDLNISEGGKISFTLGDKKRSYKDESIASQLSEKGFETVQLAEKFMLINLLRDQDISKGKAYEASNEALINRILELEDNPDAKSEWVGRYKTLYPDSNISIEPEKPQSKKNESLEPEILINGFLITDAKKLEDGNIQGKHFATNTQNMLEGVFSKNTGLLIDGKITFAKGNDSTGSSQAGKFDSKENLISGKKTFPDGNYFEGTFFIPSDNIASKGLINKGTMTYPNGRTEEYKDGQIVVSPTSADSTSTHSAPVESDKTSSTSSPTPEAIPNPTASKAPETKLSSDPQQPAKNNTPVDKSPTQEQAPSVSTNNPSELPTAGTETELKKPSVANSDTIVTPQVDPATKNETQSTAKNTESKEQNREATLVDNIYKEIRKNIPSEIELDENTTKELINGKLISSETKNTKEIAAELTILMVDPEIEKIFNYLNPENGQSLLPSEGDPLTIKFDSLLSEFMQNRKNPDASKHIQNLQEWIALKKDIETKKITQTQPDKEPETAEIKNYSKEEFLSLPLEKQKEIFTNTRDKLVRMNDSFNKQMTEFYGISEEYLKNQDIADNHPVSIYTLMEALLPEDTINGWALRDAANYPGYGTDSIFSLSFDTFNELQKLDENFSIKDNKRLQGNILKILSDKNFQNDYFRVMALNKYSEIQGKRNHITQATTDNYFDNIGQKYYKISNAKFSDLFTFIKEVNNFNNELKKHEKMIDEAQQQEQANQSQKVESNTEESKPEAETATKVNSEPNSAPSQEQINNSTEVSKDKLDQLQDKLENTVKIYLNGLQIPEDVQSQYSEFYKNLNIKIQDTVLRNLLNSNAFKDQSNIFESLKSQNNQELLKKIRDNFDVGEPDLGNIIKENQQNQSDLLKLFTEKNNNGKSIVEIYYDQMLGEFKDSTDPATQKILSNRKINMNSIRDYQNSLIAYFHNINEDRNELKGIFENIKEDFNLESKNGDTTTSSTIVTTAINSSNNTHTLEQVQDSTKLEAEKVKTISIDEFESKIPESVKDLIKLVKTSSEIVLNIDGYEQRIPQNNYEIKKLGPTVYKIINNENGETGNFTFSKNGFVYGHYDSAGYTIWLVNRKNETRKF